MKLMKVALAGVVLALAGVAPLPMAHEAPPPHAGAYAYHLGAGGSWLGVSIDDVDAERSRELGLRETAGAEVKDVHPGSPADKAGLQAGDVILRYQGTRVEGARQLTRLVRETPSGRTVTIEVFREGSTLELEATIEEREESRCSKFEIGKFIAPGFERGEIEIPGIEIPGARIHGFRLHGAGRPLRLGASVDNLTEQLGDYFGVKNGEGVLVKSVQEDGPGARAGLRAGDVIVAVDDETISSYGDLRRAMRERRGKEFVLTVVRERKEMTLTVDTPEEEVSSGEPKEHKTISIKVM